MAKGVIGTRARIEGLEELHDLLSDELPNAAHQIARGAVLEVAKMVAADVKQNAPKRTGNLRKAVKARRTRGSRTAVGADVYVQKGTGSVHDAFYWRFVEHGTAAHSTASGANADLIGQRVTRTGKRHNTQAFGRAGKDQIKNHPGTKAQPFVGPVVERYRGKIPALFKEKVGVVLERTLQRRKRKAAKQLDELGA